MTSRELYKRFTNLCQRWPKDESKTGRDYADFFRVQLSKYFQHGELGQVEDPRALEATLSSLERLANDAYFNENQLKRGSASGLEAWACKDAISNEAIRQLQEEDEATLIDRLRNKLNVRFLASKSDYKISDEFSDSNATKENNKIKLKS